MQEETTALKPAETGTYAMLTRPPQEVRGIIQANLGAASGSVFDLDTVTVPAGGQLRWALPTLEGSEERETFEGIIVLFSDVRAYWSEEFSGSEPPQCAADDGLTGVGDPGGPCVHCPFSQWGSDPKGGRGQACKQMRRLFIAVPDMLLPYMLVVPPTSVAASRKYLVRLISAQVPHWGVVTRFSLESAANKTGIKYSRVAFSVARTLKDDEAARVKQFSDALQPLLLSTPMPYDGQEEQDATDVKAEEAGSDTGVPL